MRIDPDTEAAVNLGNARLAAGRTDEALELYRHAIELDRTNEKAHHNLALVLANQGKLDEAIARLREAVRLAPTSVAANAALAEVLQQAGHDEEALVPLEAAHRSAPDDPARAIDLATALVGLRRTGDAVAVLQDMLRRHPDDATLVGSLAWIRATASDARWRDGPEAVRLAERAAALAGADDPDRLDTLAAAYAEAGRFAEATRTARRAIEAAEPGSELAQDIGARLVLYEAKQPFRSP